jgi:hypothetical protein
MERIPGKGALRLRNANLRKEGPGSAPANAGRTTAQDIDNLAEN